MFKPRKIHILDPGLVNTDGHYYTQDLLLAKEASKRGISVKVYTSEGFNYSLEDIDFQKIFRFDVYAESSDLHKDFGAFQNYFLVNRVFFSDLQKIDTSDFAAEDLVYVSSVTQNQLEAIGDWICTIPAKVRPTLAVTLRFLNSQMHYNASRGFTDSIEFLYQCIVGKIRDRHARTWFFSDTPELANLYSTVTGSLVHPLSVPELDFQPDLKLKNIDYSKRLNILYIGSISSFRGYEFLPKIITQTLQKYSNVDFTIQVNANPDGDVARFISNISSDLVSRVRFIYGSLSRVDYVDLIKSADILLLPYMPEYYRHGASGVFCEGVSLGKVICTTAGTTMAGDVSRYDLGVSLARNYSVDAIQEALNESVDDFKVLNEKQQTSYSKFSLHHSPQGFWTSMFEIVS